MAKINNSGGISGIFRVYDIYTVNWARLELVLIDLHHLITRYPEKKSLSSYEWLCLLTNDFQMLNRLFYPINKKDFAWLWIVFLQPDTFLYGLS